MEQVTESSRCSVSDSEISYLLQRLTIMSKKPTIEAELSQALDEYLDKLSECEKYLEHGIFNVNFAEAALLLQSSADIYSKKVDLLWDIIFDYQKRLLLNDAQQADKDEQIQKLEERKRKYKRKRKTKESEQQTSKLVNSFSFEAAEYVDYVNAIYEQNDLLSEWEKFNASPPPKSIPSLSSNRESLFLPNTAIHTEDGEYVGRYDQFHFASLIENVFESDKEQEPDLNHATKITINSNVHNDLLMEKPLSAIQTYTSELSKNIDDFAPLYEAEQMDTTERATLKDIYITLERLPSRVIEEKLRRLSNADSLFDDDNFSSVSENCTDSCVDHNENHVKDVCDDGIDPVTGTIEKRNKSCSQDSAFYEMEDEEQGHFNDGINTPLPETTRTTVVNKQMCCGGPVLTRGRLVKRKSFMNELKPGDLREEKVKKRRTLKTKNTVSEKVLKKLSKGITANHKEFEKFCRTQYRPAEGEGQVPPDSDSSSDEEDAAAESSSDDEESVAEPFTADYDPAVIPDSVVEDDLEEPEEPVENTEIVKTTVANSTSLPPPPEASAPLPSSPQLEELRKNIREWRDFIVPKLKSLTNRSDFDIHEYGSRIMEGSAVGQERSFANMVRGKGAAEVARYFLATLQLATTSNVEIVGAAPGRLSNDSFKVKTLDKTRYHELLDEYQAPSEETFRDRLERAQALNPKVPLHSTPSAGSPKKKIKVATTWKKLF